MEKKVMCHAHGGPALKAAIDAGVHSVDHGLLLGRHARVAGADGRAGHLLRPDAERAEPAPGPRHALGMQKANEMYDDAARTLEAADKAGVQDRDGQRRRRLSVTATTAPRWSTSWTPA